MDNNKSKVPFFLLASCRNELQQRAFINRAEQFFLQSQVNGVLIGFGALLVAFLLHQYDADTLLLTAWLISFVIVIGLLCVTDRLFNKNDNATKIHRLLLIRLAIGMAIALLFGISMCLAPEDIAGAQKSTLLITLFFILFIVVMSHLIFPEYFICYPFFILGSQLLNLPFFQNQEMLMQVALLVVAAVVIILKATNLSKIAIREVEIRILLQDEIKAHIATQEQIKHLALHDELTSLPNRRQLNKIGELMLSSAQRSNSKVGLIYIDLDNFKVINDTHGHHFGDQALKAASSRMTNIIRTSDLACRIGGDEFIILVPNINSRKTLPEIISKLTAEFSNPLVVGDITIHLEASFGTVTYPDAAKDLDSLIGVADRLMYKHKIANKLKQSSTCLIEGRSSTAGPAQN